MDLSARARKTLLIMLEEDSPISVVKLAEKIGVSKRTIQRELESLPKSLLPYNLKFTSKTGVGVWIVGEDIDKQILLSKLKAENNIDDTDREYRRKKLILELLKDKSVKKLFWYSTKFKVSEATISTDLEALEDWFKKFNLKIIKKPGSGISVNGIEANYRKAIKSFITESIDANFLLSIYEEESTKPDILVEFQNSGFMQILGEDTIRRVIDCTNSLNNTHLEDLTESSYTSLIMHTSIAVKRILSNETIEESSHHLDIQPSDADYRLAEKIAIELEEEFEISISKDEISYIYLHIRASKYEKIHSNLNINHENTKIIADDMIYAFDETKAYLLKQDEDFLYSLLAHLSPTIVRLTNGMKIHNPMLNEVRAQYKDVYAKCENAALVLEKYIGRTIPDAEIGFLTVHFAAALVRLETAKSKTKIVNIGIICSSGIGLSRLMRSKLKHIFKERVLLTAYGKNDIDASVINKEDFLISSLPLNTNDIEVLEVKPLLPENDIDNIRKLIRKYEVQEIERKEVSLTLELETISFLANQMRSIANTMNIYKLDTNIDFLNAVEQISKLACKEGDDSTIVADDILKRENISSQIFPEFEFALLHARSKGVNSPSFNIFTNVDLDSFKSPDFKGIKIIFVMLIPQDENAKLNSEILGCISSTLVEESKLIDMVLAGDNDSAVKHIYKTFKTFFAEYIVSLSE